MYLIMDFEWKMKKDFASFTTLPETSSEFAPENTRTESQKGNESFSNYRGSSRDELLVSGSVSMSLCENAKIGSYC